MSFKKIGVLVVSVFLIIFIFINIFNKSQIYPSYAEKLILDSLFQWKEIKNEKDVLDCQDKVLATIIHEYNFDGKSAINIIKIVHDKMGMCYDQSMILQKYFIYRGFKVRPVLLFFNNSGHTRWTDIFLKNLQTHNIFEINIDGKWLVIDPSIKLVKLMEIQDYLKISMLPLDTKYLRYVNNRNGKFIYPSYIPDIYGFF